MNMKCIEKKVFVATLREMKKSLSWVREEQRLTGRFDIEDDINLLKLSQLLDCLIEKGIEELAELKGE